MTKSGLAVVGIAEVPTRRDPERTRWDILLDVCMGAINDAGIDKNLIGAVISNNPMAQPSMQNDMSLGKIPEVMGLRDAEISPSAMRVVLPPPTVCALPSSTSPADKWILS